ncbi:MAG: BREX system P-loop protein BrxC, partial [Enterococcus sp.]|nr:BREX system P-loop protein BrxC [Enterococcus sp.]
MKIKDMFLKDIHRNIEGVITASQANDEQVYQELDEYVVTKELQTHFKTFFDAYKKGIIGDTSKMGVWIQGFFGSGKSHFLKILSYILENKEINGKNAFDFFTEGDEITRKIKDDITIADMKLAVDTPTNVILFNVESKHQTGIEEKSSLVNVFLKVFNHSLGYSTIPQLADLERNLDKQGKFAHFKAIFEQNYGETWEETRHEIDFLEDIVVESLVKAECFSESAARNWFTKNESDYKISIEEFADLVEEYLQSKGNNEHIVFLVDEIGQYIGGNRSLTLQLQTIVEELGNKSRGKAWVIVTSQELIDAVTDISGSSAMDFSKIKGRFETTLSLSSANADEVIQKRILKKNINAQQYLEADYPNHENDISMKLQFEDSPELKLYTDAENYADVYPFIPYQFNLLANILTQISEHSIQGTNLSRGERSLLAFFKETAERNADKENGSLISLDQFYPSLEKWLNETKNDAVIKKAADNSRIVSDANDFFNVDVLKVLFMIKYVDQNIKPTLNNITNLMLRHVDEDKLALRKKVDAALKILINENLIRQNLQNYIFQTDEEQEVTRVINKIELT